MRDIASNNFAKVNLYSEQSVEMEDVTGNTNCRTETEGNCTLSLDKSVTFLHLSDMNLEVGVMNNVRYSLKIKLSNKIKKKNLNQFPLT